MMYALRDASFLLLLSASTESFSPSQTSVPKINSFNLNSGHQQQITSKKRFINELHSKIGNERKNIFLSLQREKIIEQDISNPWRYEILSDSSIQGFDEDDDRMKLPLSTATNIHINQFFDTPFIIILQDMAMNISRVISSDTFAKLSLPARPIVSGQKQLPWIERIPKAIHEESAPWMLSFFIPSVVSMALNNILPLQASISLEITFLIFCSIKLFTKFDVPSTNPEPLLNNRNWTYIYNSIWKYQKDIQSKRSFVTSWFYDVPFEQIRREDAIRFIAWLKFSVEESEISSFQRYEIETIDLPRLEKEANNGVRIRSRAAEEEPLGCLRFNLEPLRFRFKPFLFYFLTHGIKFYAKQALDDLGFSYTPPKDPKTDLGYFYRPAKQMENKTPLVFVHGVGGISTYYNLIKEIVNKNDSSVILIDLPFVSLQMSDDIPSIIDQSKSVCNILDETVGKNTKATFVGHSFGSLILSWMVQSHPDRVANCVFIDPVCFQLHLRNILYNFHYARVDESQKGKQWESPFSLESLINLAGTEMYTNNAMLRHFWWATNALWPSDLEKNNIPASILVSENDEIVPSAEIKNLFSDYENEVKQSFSFFSNKKNKVFIRAKMLNGANHGEFVFNDAIRDEVVSNILAMMRLNNDTEKKLEAN